MATLLYTPAKVDVGYNFALGFHGFASPGALSGRTASESSGS